MTCILNMNNPRLLSLKSRNMSSLLKFAILMLVIISRADCIAQEIIFLTHSVGSGLYKEGKIAERFTQYNADHGTDYLINRRSYPEEPYPWDNDPYDYWNVWVNGTCSSNVTGYGCLSSIVEKYDVVIMKHCYTAARIEPDIGAPDIASNRKSIENYKLQYRAIRDRLDSYPETKFIVFTLTPRHRLRTDAAQAARAKSFADWVKNEWLQEDGKEHGNIFIFDWWGYIAENNPAPEQGAVNCLRYDYEKDHSSDNSHPNLLANETMGPVFANYIVETIEGRQSIPVAAISVTSAAGEASISTDKGTLQLNATVLPEDATNISVTWSIQDGTGLASIDASGMVTAIANGTVTAMATATDGSGVYGTLLITITNQFIAVTGIEVTGEGGATGITTSQGTLQLYAAITPADASDKTVHWSVQNETGQAEISPEGMLTAISDGEVVARAASTDGSNITGSLNITITNQLLPTGLTNNLPEAVSIKISHSAIRIDLNKDTPYDQIRIYTLTGSPVLAKNIRAMNEIVEVAHFLPGVYIMVLSGEGEILTRKLVLH